MDRAEYVQLYTVPETYQPPADGNLHLDTRYPNLNSRDFRKRLSERDVKHQFLESLSFNENGLMILASNDLVGRNWCGSIWGYEKMENISESTACFKLQCDSPVTRLKFLQDKIFLAAQANGSLKLWSTQSEARNAEGFCLFMISERTEHLGIILDLDVLLPQSTKAVTGSSDATIKVWDSGSADLICCSSMPFSHSDAITGIASSPNMNEIFATSSRDKSVLVWDYRLPRPAKVLCENHAVGFSTIYWCHDCELGGNVLLGDESGFVYQYDIKVPHKYVSKLKIINSEIRKIVCNKSKTAVISDSNVVCVYNNMDTLIYKNREAENFVRDISWKSSDDFYTVGWDKKVRHHKLKPEDV